MSRPDYEKVRQVERRVHGGSMKGFDKLNRPESQRRRFDRTPVTTKPKGWGFA